MKGIFLRHSLGDQTFSGLPELVRARLWQGCAVKRQEYNRIRESWNPSFRRVQVRGERWVASSIGEDKARKSLILDVDQDCIERRCRLMVLGMASRMVTLAITNKNQTTKRNMTDPP